MINLHLDDSFSLTRRGAKFKNWISDNDKPYNPGYRTSKDIHGYVYQIKNESPIIVDTFEFHYAFDRQDSYFRPKKMKNGTIKIVKERFGGYNNMMYVFSDNEYGTTSVYRDPGVVRNRQFWLPGNLDMAKATKIAEEYYANKKHQVTMAEILHTEDT